MCLVAMEVLATRLHGLADCREGDTTRIDQQMQYEPSCALLSFQAFSSSSRAKYLSLSSQLNERGSAPALAIHLETSTSAIMTLWLKCTWMRFFWHVLTR